MPVGLPLLPARPADQILGTHNLSDWSIIVEGLRPPRAPPESLAIPNLHDRIRNALYRGGHADVRKRKYHNQNVAVKVIRTHSDDELQKVIHASS